MANIFERDKMLTKDEFSGLLYEAVFEFLKAFPREEVKEYLAGSFAQRKIDDGYAECVNRFKASKLEHPNEVFAYGISHLAHLLELCFE